MVDSFLLEWILQAGVVSPSLPFLPFQQQASTTKMTTTWLMNFWLAWKLELLGLKKVRIGRSPLARH